MSINPLWTRPAVHSTPSGNDNLSINFSVLFSFRDDNKSESPSIRIYISPRLLHNVLWTKRNIVIWILNDYTAVFSEDAIHWNSSLPNLTRKSWRRWTNSFPRENYQKNFMRVSACSFSQPHLLQCVRLDRWTSSMCMGETPLWSEHKIKKKQMMFLIYTTVL